MRTIPLSDPSLEARVGTTRFSDDTAHDTVTFRCPICGDHSHVVPFRPEGGKSKAGLVWTHVSGSTVDDLTISPSYLSRCDRGDIGKTCRLHIFIKGGQMQILGDSGHSMLMHSGIQRQHPISVWVVSYLGTTWVE